MRLLLFILGVFVAVVCIEKPVDAQNGAWCIYKPDTPAQCRYATLEQCLADRLGKGGWVLWTQSIPVVARAASVNQAPEALSGKVLCRASGSLAIFQRDPRLRFDGNQSSDWPTVFETVRVPGWRRTGCLSRRKKSWQMSQT